MSINSSSRQTQPRTRTEDSTYSNSMWTLLSMGSFPYFCLGLLWLLDIFSGGGVVVACNGDTGEGCLLLSTSARRHYLESGLHLKPGLQLSSRQTTSTTTSRPLRRPFLFHPDMYISLDRLETTQFLLKGTTAVALATLGLLLLLQLSKKCITWAISRWRSRQKRHVEEDREAQQSMMPPPPPPVDYLAEEDDDF